MSGTIPPAIAAPLVDLEERVARIAPGQSTELTALVDLISRRVGDELRHASRERAMVAIDLPAVDAPPVSSTATPSPAVARVLARAYAEWVSGVAEPPRVGALRIDEYIRDPQGLGWASADKDHLDQPRAYQRNGQFAWCGAFAAYCWSAGGLRPRIRRDAMPSCYKLHSWAAGSARMVLPQNVQAGDVVVVGPADGHRWGAHITLASGPPQDGQIPTYEGNASGEGPRGPQEGVIRRKRPLSAQDARTYRALYAVRFLDEDLEG